MSAHVPEFQVKLATTEEELRAAQRLRYRVFVEELGADGDMVDHDARLEIDRFDAYFDHLILRDNALKSDPLDQVVGVYRLLREEQAVQIGQFYSEDEYDLTALKASGRRLLELGRSCLLPAYRGGVGMFHLWSALAAYVSEHDIDILFGVASFHGTDVNAHAAALSLLHHRHLAPKDIRTRAQKEVFEPMDLIPEEQIDRRAAMLAVPPLIKAYLRIGGFVGEGAYLDHAFNTTDVCLILDTARMNEKNRALYTKGRKL
ncbi:GNAT family N-acetyltransferase [Shimia marina]|uniref:L-ornithine N(alpha)-acyltransferase n=1 Tax=Shimia marina TaxID=321267 RepID=A0A0P1ETJ7_9RHOB|nr:GNAT family N-acyltransferase [Shimia marina]CUH53669.1 N-acyl amino acid synthase, PEP-CTERM/exosortase system-associated [Shimia marina]SFD71488.1 ornithine-acyl[acyl carrier protein] N-acyltransferase [Shimia marina]